MAPSENIPKFRPVLFPDVTNVAPVRLDFSSVRPFYIDPAGLVSVPQALVLQGTQQVTAGSAWSITLSCTSDGPRVRAGSLRLSAIKF